MEKRPKEKKSLSIKDPYQNHLICGMHTTKFTDGTRSEAEKVSNKEVTKCFSGITLNSV